MAILSKSARPFIQSIQQAASQHIPRALTCQFNRHIPIVVQSTQSSSSPFSSTFPTLLSHEPHGLSEGIGKVFSFDYANMPVVEIMEMDVLKKLEEYCVKCQTRDQWRTQGISPPPLGELRSLRPFRGHPALLSAYWNLLYHC